MCSFYLLTDTVPIKSGAADSRGGENGEHETNNRSALQEWQQCCFSGSRPQTFILVQLTHWAESMKPRTSDMMFMPGEKLTADG